MNLFPCIDAKEHIYLMMIKNERIDKRYKDFLIFIFVFGNLKNGSQDGWGEIGTVKKM